MFSVEKSLIISVFGRNIFFATFFASVMTKKWSRLGWDRYGSTQSNFTFMLVWEYEWRTCDDRKTRDREGKVIFSHPKYQKMIKNKNLSRGDGRKGK